MTEHSTADDQVLDDQDDQVFFVPEEDQPKDDAQVVVDDLVALLAPSYLGLMATTEPTADEPYPLAPRLWSSRGDQRFNEIRKDRLRAMINYWSFLAGGGEPVLDQLKRYADIRDEADRNVRLLLAYALTAAPPAHTHVLRELGHAAGLTPSGVRTASTDDEIAEVNARLGASRKRRRGIRQRWSNRKGRPVNASWTD